MSFVIENNAFTRDSYGVRSTRLSLLSENIDDYSAELSIEADQLAWAQDVAQAWQDLLADNTLEQGEKFEAFQTSQEADDALEDRYASLKTLLIARYGDDDEMLRLYGIDGPTPDSARDVVNKAYDLVSTNEERLAEGDPKALPQAMADGLKVVADDAYNKYKTAIKELSEAKTSTVDLNGLLDEDSVKLRLMYAWVTSFWGKKDPRLLMLGFVQTKDHSGGHTPDAPQNLEYDSVMSRFTWIAAEGATSYQLAYRETGSKEEWEEAYKGPETSVVFHPAGGNWQFRVRARNEHGYGDWSNTVTVEIEGGIPAPDWLTAVYYPAPFPIPTPPPKILPEHVLLEWANIAEATMYEVWRSVVNVGAPAGVFTILEEHDSELYHDFDVALNKRYYYYIVAKNDTDRSVASVEAWADAVE